MQSDGTTLIGTASGWLYRLDPNWNVLTGITWGYGTTTGGVSAISVLEDDSILVGSFDGQVWRLNSQNTAFLGYSGAFGSVTALDVGVVPEPGTLVCLSGGLFGLIGVALRRRK